MKDIYFLRHPEIEKNGRYIGRTDVELSERGRKQVDEILSYFKEIPLETVISSPLKRCKALAEKIALQKDTGLIIDGELSEINFGLWEGLDYKEIMGKYPGEWEEYLARPTRFTFPEGDNVAHYIEKCIRCFDEYTKEYDGSLLFITHAGFIRSIISGVLYNDKERFFEINCSYASGYILNERGFLKIM
ncbi:MAG: alpha-ribazole phosphatase family protein [Thermoanaerobacteraceae bacterium]|nr:alpha-ribazole phosphatase family protein [Thermoanaerobacteraceae bacterium]